jgi:hypothetical protein
MDYSTSWEPIKEQWDEVEPHYNKRGDLTFWRLIRGGAIYLYNKHGDLCYDITNDPFAELNDDEHPDTEKYRAFSAHEYDTSQRYRRPKETACVLAWEIENEYASSAILYLMRHPKQTYNELRLKLRCLKYDIDKDGFIYKL